MKFTVSLLAVIAVAEANFKSGSVSTYEKFTYGKFVTRMKAPDKMGTVSSFFTYWDGPGFYPGGWNELDIEIVPSVQNNPLSTNVIYGDGHNKLEEHDYAHEFDPHSDWHTYMMEWTPDYISFAIDGNEVRHLNASDVSAVEFVNKAQSLRMNFWTPTFNSWGKGFDPSDMPWYVLYDYVEVFSYNQHKNEFEFHWRDDFNAFDSGRWHKASGGFEANSSIFYPSNVYTSAGNLVIKMEPMDGDHHESLHEGAGLHGVLHVKDTPAERAHKRAVEHGLVHATTHGHGEEEHEDTIREVLHEQAQGQHVMPRHHWTQAHKYGKDDVAHKTSLHLTDHHSEPEQRVAAYHAEHEDHHALDHAHDDQHDIEPVNFHEHDIHKATLHTAEHHDEPSHHELLSRQFTHHVSSPMAQYHEGFYQEPTHREDFQHEQVRHETPHHEAFHIEGPAHLEPAHHADVHLIQPTHYEVRREPEHHEPVHEQVQHEVPHEQVRHEPARHEPAHPEPVHREAQHHESEHHDEPQVHPERLEQHDTEYHAKHEDHRALDHAHDSQHDVEPVHFHEHAIHHAVDRPESHDYRLGDFKQEKEQHHYYDRHYRTEEAEHDDHRTQIHEDSRFVEDKYSPVHHEIRHEESHRPVVHRERHYEVASHHEPEHFWTEPSTHESEHWEHTAVHDEDRHEFSPLASFDHLDDETTPFEHSHREGHHYEHEDPHHEEQYYAHQEPYWTSVEYEVPTAHQQERRERAHHEALHHDKPRVHHERHEQHDTEYHVEHETHHELDHRFDDQHDVEPVHFHEHAIHHAVDRPESRAYHAEDFEQEAHYEEPIRREDSHEDRHERVYRYEVPFEHEHGHVYPVEHEHEHGHVYRQDGHRERYEGHEQHDSEYHVEHETHHELDHRFDDQHDVEPVHFHEHAIHRAVDRPESRSYHADEPVHSDEQHAIHRAFDFEQEQRGESHHEMEEFRFFQPEPEHHEDLYSDEESHFWEGGEAQYHEPLHEVTVAAEPYDHHGVHYEVDEDLGGMVHYEHGRHGYEHMVHEEHDPVHFVMEEPMHEVSHETFHGREHGYMYREQEDEHPFGHIGYHEEAGFGTHHGETYGPHVDGDRYEMEHGHEHVDHDIEVTRFVEPLYEQEFYDHHTEEMHREAEHHDLHFETPKHRPREVEYEVDAQGHVHMFEEEPQYAYSFLQ